MAVYYPFRISSRAGSVIDGDGSKLVAGSYYLKIRLSHSKNAVVIKAAGRGVSGAIRGCCRRGGIRY